MTATATQNSVEIKLTLPAATVESHVTILEDGSCIDYWGRIQWGTEGVLSEAGVKITPTEEGDFDEKTLNREAFLRGIQLFCETFPGRVGEVLDPCNADIETLDLIVQFAVLGEIVYG